MKKKRLFENVGGNSFKLVESDDVDLTNLNDRSVRNLDSDNFKKWYQQMEDRSYGLDDTLQGHDSEFDGYKIRDIPRKDLLDMYYTGFPFKDEVDEFLFSKG